LDIRYQIPPGVNLHLLDEELLTKFKQSGLYVINPQFETGNQETVRYIRKPINLAKGVEIIDKANQMGFWTKTNIILGFPNETREDIETTIRFVENLNIDAVNIVLPIAYSHTDLGKDYIRLGLMASDQIAARTCDSLHFTKEQLEEFRLSAIRRFNKARIRRFLSPRYIVVSFFPKVNDIEKLWLFARRLWFGLFQRFYKNM
jgi:radical SAM superfamily enzyme